MCLCMSTGEKRMALLLGYVALTLLSIGCIVASVLTATDMSLRFSFRFLLFWHAWMATFTLLLLAYWRCCQSTSNFFLAASIVSLFMMALQSVSTTVASFTSEKTKTNDTFTSGQEWVGIICLLYTVCAATHLGMMCAWRDIDINAYEAVPMRVLAGGFDGQGEGAPPKDDFFHSG
ncbi:hypothetical protein AAMO2058_001277000 [Amorphochlora amoebiformis]